MTIKELISALDGFPLELQIKLLSEGDDPIRDGTKVLGVYGVHGNTLGPDANAVYIVG